MSKKKRINVEYLARVEGEGSFDIEIEGDKVIGAKLGIFEPPRFFEAFLKGRDFKEVPDITARICGICPVAYQMSSVYAMEDALKVELPPEIHRLRRLLYCGEWIESHVLHIYMLHAPDFLKYEDSIRLAKDHPEVVKKGLKLKKIGNEIVRVFGGREIHPINVRVGGFYHLPKKKEIQGLLENLKWAKGAAIDTIDFAAGLPFPDFEMDYEFVSLRDEKDYPFNGGRLVSNKGLDIDIKDYNKNFEEIHVEYSNALQCVNKDRGNYFVGPMARFHNNFDKLRPEVQAHAKKIGIHKNCRNPFKSIIIRSLEVYQVILEAIETLENYERPGASFVPVTPKKATGYSCTEAPRGILYHQYDIEDDGSIAFSQIVPPTSQNQRIIEEDLINLVEKSLPDYDHESLKWQCEQAIRNYDPCISCATHFLKLNITEKRSSIENDSLRNR